MTQEQIEKIKEKMCDEYCRFPRMPGTHFAMDVICMDCPMNKLEADE